MLDDERTLIYFFELGSVNHAGYYVPCVYGTLRNVCESFEDLDAHYKWAAPVSGAVGEITDLVKTFQSGSVFAFSCYIWNYEWMLAISQEIKKQLPDSLIIFGGPQVPDHSEGFFEKCPWVDLLAHKEGETILPHLLKEYLKEDTDWSRVKGISYSEDGQSRYTGDAEKYDLSSVTKSPLDFDEIRDFIRNAKARYPRLIISLETTRGCPYRCSFCDWGSSTMSKIRPYALEKIKRDFDLISEYQIDEAYIADSNFGILPQDLEIARHIAQLTNGNSYPRCVGGNYSKAFNKRCVEIVKTFKRSKMAEVPHVTFSAQSMSPEVLKNIGRSNIKIENYLAVKDELLNEGIKIYTELILGLPGETRESFCRGLTQLIEYGVESKFMLYYLDILENAPMNNPETIRTFDLQFREWRRKLPDCSYEGKALYETSSRIYRTKDLSPEDIIYCALFFYVVTGIHKAPIRGVISSYAHDHHHVSYWDIYRVLAAALIERFPFYSQYQSELPGELIDRKIIVVIYEILSQNFSEFIGICEDTLLTEFSVDITEAPGYFRMRENCAGILNLAMNNKALIA